jgi:hypothetical protein
MNIGIAPARHSFQSAKALHIDRLLSEPVFASRIRRMAQRNAGNRDWSTVAERVRAIYVAILQQAPDLRESALSSGVDGNRASYGVG